MGVERLKKAVGSDGFVSALPADHPLFVSNAFKRADPAALIVVETELWPNLLLTARKRGIPVILANGRISNTTLVWAKRFPRTFKKITDCIDRFLMKSPYDAQNLEKTGVSPDRIETIGNLKFAGVSRDVKPAKIDRSPVIVAGSIRLKEFDSVFKAFAKVRADYPDSLLVAAPRHLNMVPQLTVALKTAGLDFVQRTGTDSPGDAAVYILNTMGELLRFYAAADVAFVGGTLADYGGHNPLEPAYFGVPVLFGPHQSANREAFETLIDSGGGRTVSNATDLADELLRLLRNDELHKEMREKARETVRKMHFVPDKYENALTEFLRAL